MNTRSFYFLNSPKDNQNIFNPNHLMDFKTKQIKDFMKINYGINGRREHFQEYCQEDNDVVTTMDDINGEISNCNCKKCNCEESQMQRNQNMKQINRKRAHEMQKMSFGYT